MSNNKFLTAKEVAELLKLNILTVYKYIKKGTLRTVRFGRNYRIEEVDLNEFIKTSRVRTKQ